MGPLARREKGRSNERQLAIDASMTEYIAFRVATSTYAIAVSLVREIVRTAHITPVPRAPPSVMGITSFRGRIVTIVDLGRRLGLACAVLPEPEDTPMGPASRVRILMIDVGSETVGLLVDEVLMVHRLGASDIERATHAVGPDVDRHVAGIARPGDGKEVILLLDAKALVA
jgi:purine-binding chemotaxis protein CheW